MVDFEEVESHGVRQGKNPAGLRRSLQRGGHFQAIKGSLSGNIIIRLFVKEGNAIILQAPNPVESLIDQNS
jgi:hypothetical protein